jgi:hypothetical protein
MRTLAALLVSCATALAGCSAWQPGAGAGTDASCELAAVPSQAVFGVRDGLDTATYPSQIPHDRTGCQRVWYGERSRPEAMKVLATYYFDKGLVRRLVGQVPDGAAYDCHYSDGALDKAGSRNAQLCPAAARIDQLPLSR